MRLHVNNYRLWPRPPGVLRDGGGVVIVTDGPASARSPQGTDGHLNDGSFAYGDQEHHREH